MLHANSIGFSQTVNLQSVTFCHGVGVIPERLAKAGDGLAQRLLCQVIRVPSNHRTHYLGDFLLSDPLTAFNLSDASPVLPASCVLTPLRNCPVLPMLFPRLG
jgi:hypothetical protein